MKRGAQGFLIFAAIVAHVGFVYADPHLVELIFLLDSSKLVDPEDLGKARDKCGDLLDNLPVKTGIRAFQFGEGPQFGSLGRHKVESLQDTVTLQQALTVAENLLCPKGSAPDYPGRVVVIVGESTGNERLALRSSCDLAVFAISTKSEADSPLRALVDKTQGRYDSLDRARGFSIASTIKGKIWRPAMIRMMRRQSEEEETDDFQDGVLLAPLLATLLAATAWFIVRHRKRQPAPDPSTSDVPYSAEPGNLRDELIEARLRICSGPGSGNSYSLYSRETFILGGKLDAAASSANLLINDPTVAGEHCQIYSDRGAFLIVNLEAGQETFVNREPIRGSTALAHGDILQIGNTCLEFTINT